MPGFTMRNDITRGILFTLVTMVLFGGVYHAVLWGVGHTLFAQQAEGSLIRRADGNVVGSSLIAQSFTSPEYFHPRPSAVDYNAAAAGGSNYGPSNPQHLKAVRERLDRVMAREQVSAGEVPSELVTTSGGGLDPHLSPAAAILQSARVASARHASPDAVRQLIDAHTEGPLFALFGRPRVNVLELNLALDASWPARSRAGETESR